LLNTDQDNLASNCESLQSNFQLSFSNRGDAGPVLPQFAYFGTGRPTPAEFLPPSTVIYGEIKDPSVVIEALKSHPVVRQILEIEGIQTLMRTPQFAAVMMY
jgi:hypothetical protein